MNKTQLEQINVLKAKRKFFIKFSFKLAIISIVTTIYQMASRLTIYYTFITFITKYQILNRGGGSVAYAIAV